MKPYLGQRVYVDKVYEWPSRDVIEDVERDIDGGGIVEFSPIDNLLKDKVAVVVGESRKKYRGEAKYYIVGDGSPFTGGSEGYYVDMQPIRRTFIVIRYELSGRRYYTTPEYLREAE
jgi:hypothetical protein